MHQILNFYNKESDNLHHAYFVITHKAKETINKLKDFFETTLSFKTTGNPDFWHKKFSTLTMDDAKDITSRELIKNLENTRKIFIIETDFITEEAQNSLLKVFEEPKLGTHFFIISSQDTLLPTLRSRMITVSEDDSDNGNKTGILKMSLKDRLKKVKEIVDGISDETQTKQEAIFFLNQIENELHEDGVLKNAEKLEICQKGREALLDRGAPIKMILENVVLSI